MTDHLPECPAPLCDWGDPSAKCMGYEDCHHLCCCAALRACKQRVLDVARKAVAAVPHRPDCTGHCPCCILGYDCNCGLRDALAAIDALREKP